MIQDAREGDILCEGQLSGKMLDDYIKEFGKADLNVQTSTWSGSDYACFNDHGAPDMSDWSNEKIEKFLEILEINDYFITEVE